MKLDLPEERFFSWIYSTNYTPIQYLQSYKVVSRSLSLHNSGHFPVDRLQGTSSGNWILSHPNCSPCSIIPFPRSSGFDSIERRLYNVIVSRMDGLLVSTSPLRWRTRGGRTKFNKLICGSWFVPKIQFLLYVGRRDPITKRMTWSQSRTESFANEVK